MLYLEMFYTTLKQNYTSLSVTEGGMKLIAWAAMVVETPAEWLIGFYLLKSVLIIFHK